MLTTGLRRIISFVVVIGAALASVSCGEVARTGRSPAFLIIDSLEGAPGNQPDEFGSNVLSDVETIIERQEGGQTVRTATIFNDLGRAAIRLGLKNIGVPTAPLGPSPLNDITITRYRIVFIRADGRNTPGVDVPYPFDGGVTATISGLASVQVGFELVRHTHKLEPPLRNLRGRGAANQINTLAEVTFYGHDQAGNEVVATGLLSVNFGDFADPTS